MGRNLKRNYKETKINGYWDVIGNRKLRGSLGRPRAIKYEELSRRDLNLIFKLLQYYKKQTVTQEVVSAGSHFDIYFDDSPLLTYCTYRKPPQNSGAAEEDRIM